MRKLELSSFSVIFALSLLAAQPAFAFGPADAIKTVTIDLLFVAPLLLIAIWLKRRKKTSTSAQEKLIEVHQLTKLADGSIAQVISAREIKFFLVTSKNGSIVMYPIDKSQSKQSIKSNEDS